MRSLPSRRRPLALLVAIALTATAAAARDREYWIDPISGSDATGDGSAAAPWRTLTYAAPRLCCQDRAHLLPGTYDEASGEVFPIRWNEGVHLLGSGADRTRISGAGPWSFLLIVEPSVVPRGAYLISGVDFDGQGLFHGGLAIGYRDGLGSPVRIRDCRFRNFLGTALSIGWHGAWTVASITVERSRFEDSYRGLRLSTTGTSFEWEETSVVRNNVFAGNRTALELVSNNDGGFAHLRTRFVNNVFLGSLVDAIYMAGTRISPCEPQVVNNIFVGNPGYAIHPLRDDAPGPGRIAANLFWQNGAAYYDPVRGALTTAAQVNGLPSSDPVWPNLDADPLLADLAGRDCHLLAGSPAIDRGAVPDAPSDDFEGQWRPSDGNRDGSWLPDIGADERAMVDLHRACLSSAAPPEPPLAAIYPFSGLNPLTPVAKANFVSGDADPDAGILGRTSWPLALYQVYPPSSYALRAVKDLARESLIFQLAP